MTAQQTPGGTDPVQLDELERLLGEANLTLPLVAEIDECRACQDEGTAEYAVYGLQSGHHAMFGDGHQAALIVAAVSALPALIAELRAARRDVDCMRLINALRAVEGDDVTIVCDNPDFNGQPNNAVECRGAWTRYIDRRFTGETLLDALSAAWVEYQRPLQPQESDRG